MSCNMSFESEKEVRKHCRTVHPKLQNTKKPRKTRVHIHRDAFAPCPVIGCNKEYKTYHTWFKHVPKCLSKRIENINSHHIKSNMSMPIKVYNDDLPFPCPIHPCKRTFSSQDNLDKHIDKCSMYGGVYPCPKCPELFRYKTDMLLHKCMEVTQCTNPWCLRVVSSGSYQKHITYCDMRANCQTCRKFFLFKNTTKSHICKGISNTSSIFDHLVVDGGIVTVEINRDIVSSKTFNELDKRVSELIDLTYPDHKITTRNRFKPMLDVRIINKM